ncbi:MAG: hypothetical protein NZ954_03980 [Thermofilaceae archaeon]|nr:hypothetical protein [Thermofilaceae archaeon]MCX8180827.1 hypothetical protein [Thermofilaceae archaeon]MDW8004613.1 hypothetical protein [Thermofilaceae archaeon]
MKEKKKLLREALDHIDEAIHLLRLYAEESPEVDETLEDLVYALEEVSEALEKLAE